MLLTSSTTVYFSSVSFVTNCQQQKFAADSATAIVQAIIPSTESRPSVASSGSSSSNNNNNSTHKSSGTLEDLALCDTTSRDYEPIFYSLMGMLVREEGMLPAEGDILDVGAQFGENACHFALLQPQRTVYTLDPSPNNVQDIRNKFGKLPNLQAVQAAIGQELGERVVDNEAFRMKLGDKFKVETMDNLFHNQGKKLAFAHLDVEGFELDTLKGGVKTIRDNKPVFTVELRVHVPETKELLDFIDKLGYDVYLVDEVCGAPHMDFRNAICFPRSLSPRLSESDTMALALATEVMFRVDSSTIVEKVLPCCKLGGTCCPSDNAADKNCCAAHLVETWYLDNAKPPPVAVRSWRPAKRATRQRRQELVRRGNIKAEE